MNTNTLSVHNQDGLELIINQLSGEVFASQSAIARMVGVSKSTVLRYFEGVAQINALKAEINTAGGIQGVVLYNEDAIYQAFAKYKPELLIQCAKAGIRLYLHHLAGYEFVASTKPKTAAEMLLESAQQLVEFERKQKELEAKLALEAQRTDELEELIHQHDCEIDRIFNPNGHYFSVLGFAKNRGLNLSLQKASAIGKQCTKFCSDNAIAIQPLTDPRFGKINTYPENIIKMFF